MKKIKIGILSLGTIAMPLVAMSCSNEDLTNTQTTLPTEQTGEIKKPTKTIEKKTVVVKVEKKEIVKAMKPQEFLKTYASNSNLIKQFNSVKKQITKDFANGSSKSAQSAPMGPIGNQGKKTKFKYEGKNDQSEIVKYLNDTFKKYSKNLKDNQNLIDYVQVSSLTFDKNDFKIIDKNGKDVTEEYKILKAKQTKRHNNPNRPIPTNEIRVENNKVRQWEGMMVIKSKVSQYDFASKMKIENNSILLPNIYLAVRFKVDNQFQSVLFFLGKDYSKVNNESVFHLKIDCTFK